MLKGTTDLSWRALWSNFHLSHLDSGGSVSAKKFAVAPGHAINIGRLVLQLGVEVHLEEIFDSLENSAHTFMLYNSNWELT